MKKDRRKEKKQVQENKLYIDEKLRKPYIIPADRLVRERQIAELMKELAQLLNDQSASVDINVTINMK
jgi:hypothetical protein